MGKPNNEIWFNGRRIKKDYRPTKMEKSLNHEQQEVVRKFFRYLIVLQNEKSVAQIMIAYRRSRMANMRGDKIYVKNKQSRN